MRSYIFRLRLTCSNPVWFNYFSRHLQSRNAGIDMKNPVTAINLVPAQPFRYLKHLKQKDQHSDNEVTRQPVGYPCRQN